MDFLGVGGGSLLVLKIETPHPLHTHIRSSLYIYNAIQHLLQRLVVISMPPHPDICPLGPESVKCDEVTLTRGGLVKTRGVVKNHHCI